MPLEPPASAPTRKPLLRPRLRQVCLDALTFGLYSTFFTIKRDEQRRGTLGERRKIMRARGLTRPHPPARLATGAAIYFCADLIVLLFVCIGIPWLLPTGKSDETLSGVACFVPVWVIWSFFGWFSLRRYLVRSFLEPYAWQRCVQCHEPLVKLPDQGTCPKCGLAYVMPDVVAAWELEYGIKADAPSPSSIS